MRAYRRKYRKTKMWIFKSIYNPTLKESLNGLAVFECQCVHTFIFCSGCKHMHTFEIYIYVNKQMQQLMKIGCTKNAFNSMLVFNPVRLLNYPKQYPFSSYMFTQLQLFNHQRKVYESQQSRSWPGSYPPDIWETLGWMRFDVLDLNEIK